MSEEKIGMEQIFLKSLYLHILMGFQRKEIRACFSQLE